MRGQVNVGLSVVVAAMVGAVSVEAVERKPLPAFDLVTADGRAVPAARLVRRGWWAVVYVKDDCGSCESVLSSFGAAEAALLAPRLVVIVATGGPDPLRAIAARHPALAGAMWLADTADSVPRRIEPAAAPLVLGMRDETIEWSLGGVLTDATDVRSVLLRWIVQ